MTNSNVHLHKNNNLESTVHPAWGIHFKMHQIHHSLISGSLHSFHQLKWAFCMAASFSTLSWLYQLLTDILQHTALCTVSLKNALFVLFIYLIISCQSSSSRNIKPINVGNVSLTLFLKSLEKCSTHIKHLNKYLFLNELLTNPHIIFTQ